MKPSLRSKFLRGNTINEQRKGDNGNTFVREINPSLESLFTKRCGEKLPIHLIKGFAHIKLTGGPKGATNFSVGNEIRKLTG